MATTSIRRDITRTTFNFLGSLIVGVIIAFTMNLLGSGWDGIFLFFVTTAFVAFYNTLVLLETNTTEERKNEAFNLVIMAFAFIASLCLSFYAIQMTMH